MKLVRIVYYLFKPLIPRRFQLWLRRSWINANMHRYKDVWPILRSAGDTPTDWPGWPDNKRFALILTHDVERQKGHDRCLDLMRLEESEGYKSLFNFVPERYSVSAEVRRTLEENGFEVGVHGLKHDGKLFQSKSIFNRRASKINRYLKEWNAEGFRSPAMHRNLQWLLDLDIVYDLSTFDADPFEPQSEGAETIFPFRVENMEQTRGFVEMPYTLAQDFTPLILMRKSNIEFWTKKVDWIAENGGMALLNTHPDYMSFNGNVGKEEFPVQYYFDLLKYIKTKYEGQYWHALPREVAKFYNTSVPKKNFKP